MKITVDYHRCEGHGLCAEQAPAVFGLDDEGELIYHFDGTDVPDGQIALARAAINSCPVAALREQR
ncbi:ferredoxin [Nocardia nova]